MCADRRLNGFGDWSLSRTGGASVLVSRPFCLILDPGVVCNLRCPFCATGSGISTLDRRPLTPETFERIVQHLPLHDLFEVSLFNWGEPFLNPHLLDYIGFFTRHGIRAIVHTNFSARDYDDAFMDALVHSGLTELVASIDGASQATYEKYRVGGNFERVIANVRKLVAARHRLESQTPRIKYKMIINRFNEGDVEAARQLAEELGVEFWLDECFGTYGNARKDWLAESVRIQYGERQWSPTASVAETPIKTECLQMWNTLVVRANGDVYPCCMTCTAESAIGNIAQAPFEDLWNGDKLEYLRRYALNPDVAEPGFPNQCSRCAFRNCIYPDGGRRAP